MRGSLRRLATIKPQRYLEPHTPTGLTGLFTHPAPRSALIYLYTSILQTLKSFPESSVYRQSTEALCKHRMAIVEGVVPDGYEEWVAKAATTMAENPEAFKTAEGGVPFEGGKYKWLMSGDEHFVRRKVPRERDDQKEEWDGEQNDGPELEGSRTTEERQHQGIAWGRAIPGSEFKTVVLEEEPALTVGQVEEIENKIGAGLIEEVIQVAEGELKLASILLKAKVWEDLEEKPVEGQWTYFMRDTGTGTTQQPPQK